MSGGESAQPGPTPPPPSGSPFGRFKTVVVGIMVATVASVAALQYAANDGGGGSSSGPPRETGIAGTWTATGTALPVRLELEDDDTGTLTVGPCTGSLAPVRTGTETATFAYTDTSGSGGCPRRSRVTVTLVDEDTLRFEQGRGERAPASGTLKRG